MSRLPFLLSPRQLALSTTLRAAAALLILATCVKVGAQTTGANPPQTEKGAPAGSYSLSGFENVNLFNGDLNFHLPLLQVGGRGGMNIPVMLSIDSIRWQLKFGKDQDNSGNQHVPNTSSTVHEEFGNTYEFYPWVSGTMPTVFLAANTFQVQRFLDANPDLQLQTVEGDNQRYFWFDSDAWQGMSPGYGPGVLVATTVSKGGRRATNTCTPGKVLTRLVFTTPDGTEYELRDQQTGGTPFQPSAGSCNSSPQSYSRGTVFASADGSGVTFFSDAPIVDQFSYFVQTQPSYPSGFLLLPDGTRYRISGGAVQWVRDRNGNLTSFAYSAGVNGAPGPLLKITDSLGRVVNFRYGVTPDAGTPCPTFAGAGCTYDEISYLAVGGAPRSVKVWRNQLSSLLRAGFSVGTYGSLFPMYEQDPAEKDTPYNPSDIVAGVELPDGRSYQLKYTAHNELARVVLPTGGAIEYDYDTYGTYINVHRAVAERRVYRDASDATPESKQVYTRVFDTTSQTTTVTVKQQRGSDGALLAGDKHYFNGYALTNQTGFYAPWREGREVKTETLAADGATPLRRVENTWKVRAYNSWYTGAQDTGPAIDPRLIETVTTLTDTSPNLVSKRTSIDPADSTGQTVGFDQFNNQTDVWEYDYGTGDAGALLRHTHTSYIGVNPSNTTDYTTALDGNSVSLRHLPLQQSVFDAGGTVRARTTFEYDKYGGDLNHAALYPRTNITGLCLTLDANGNCSTPSSTSYTTRGNVTATTSSLLNAQGVEIGSVTAYQQYDVAGNVVKVISARKKADGSNIETNFDFSDNFGSPDTDAVNNSAPAQLNGQQTYALVTKVTNAKGQFAYTQYDYSTGLVVNTQDANGTVGLVRYNDPLNRPTQVESAVNDTSPYNLHTQKTFAYDDAAHTITTTADQTQLGDNALKGVAIYDGLGRTTEAREYETGSQYVSTLTSYDALGRVSQVSNPYRPTLGESPVSTTTQYDALGRVIQVTTPDGARVASAYDGARVLVTDQANRQRLSRTDALGRLAEVWEIRSADAASGTEAVSFPAQAGVPTVSAGYRTSYAYDVLGNLCKVTQDIPANVNTQYPAGVQQRRYFYYDSLSRLLRAKMPEQEARAALNLDPTQTSLLSDNNNNWSLSYEYNDDGSLKKRADARGVETSYAYDELGRVNTRSYSDTTPAVTYGYDDPSVAKSVGRLTKVSSSVSETDYAEYDALGRVRQSRQVTGDQTYGMSYDYYLGGALKSETYPSGRVVSDGYDGAGRLSSVTGQKAGEDDKPYASMFAYAAHGAVSSLKLGNLLWEHTSYNTRLQPTQIGLGTSATDSSTLKLDYTYGVLVNGTLDTAQNSGDVQSQTITAGSLTLQQSYEYDELNRLKSAREVNSQNPCPLTPDQTHDCWRQVYKYDRYGNRTLDSGTSAPTIPQGGGEDPMVNPSVSPTSNRVTSSGYVFDPAGNMTSAPNYLYAYDGEGRMTQANNTGPIPTSGVYSYDGDGHRVKKVTAGGTTVFVYDAAGQLIAEYASAAQANGTQYVTADTLGSPRVMTNAGGGVVSRHDYRPFGEEVTSTEGGRGSVPGYGGGDSLRQKFTGYQHDDEANLDFAQSRYYSNQSGRFTSPDPLLTSGKPAVPQSWNRYAYCGNNPTGIVDPTGLDWWYKTGERTAGGLPKAIPVWFDKDPGKGYERWTSISGYVYQSNVTGNWYVLNPYRNEHQEYTTQEEALGTFRNYVGLNFGFSEGSLADKDFMGGIAEGISPLGPAIGLINESRGLDTSSRDYYGGLLTGILIGGGINVTSEAATVLRELTPTSASVATAEKALARGATEVHVNSPEEAAEIYLRNYHHEGYINTTGMSGNEVRNNPFLFPNGKQGTYHWDMIDTQHGGIPHLQVEKLDGTKIRIFFPK